MEEQTQWGYLKQFLEDIELQGKQGWLADSSASSCSKCYNAFTFTVRRHHCRICGNIFCNKCCNKKAVTVNKDVRHIRVCDKCFRVLKTLTTNLEHSIKERNYERKARSNIAIRKSFFDNPFREEEKKPLLRKSESIIGRRMEQILEEHIKKLCKHISEEHKIPEEYGARLESFVLMAISTVRPSATIGDSMSFTDYVKIKLLPGKDISATQYVNGVVFTKNVADKKMKRDIQNPIILLISGDLAEQKEEIEIDSFKEIINKEGFFASKLMRVITKIKPSIIVVEKEVSVPILDALRQEDITVFCNVKSKIMEKIARLTGTIACPTADLLSQHLPLGKCKRCYVECIQKPQKDSISRIDNSFCYFEGCIDSLGCTLCIAGQEIEVIKNIKKALKKMLLFGRDLALETAFLADSNFYFSNSEVKPYLMNALGLELYLTCPMIEIQKLYIHQGEMAINAERDERSINKKGRRLCGPPTKLQLEFYGKGDYPFGEFLTSIISIISEECSQCDRKRFTHQILFCHNTGMMIVSVSPNNEIIDDIMGDSLYIRGRCKKCLKIVTKTTKIEELYEYSLGRVMLQYFYNQKIANRMIDSNNCKHSITVDIAREIFNKDAIITIEYKDCKLYEFLHGIKMIDSLEKTISVDTNSVEPYKKYGAEYIKLVSLQLKRCSELLMESVEFCPKDKVAGIDAVLTKLQKLGGQFMNLTNALSKHFGFLLEKEEEKKEQKNKLDAEPIEVLKQKLYNTSLKEKILVLEGFKILECLIHLFEANNDPNANAPSLSGPFVDSIKICLTGKDRIIDGFIELHNYFALQDSRMMDTTIDEDANELYDNIEKNYGLLIANLLRTSDYKEIMTEIFRANPNEDKFERTESELLTGNNYGIQMHFEGIGKGKVRTITGVEVFKNYTKCELRRGSIDLKRDDPERFSSKLIEDEREFEKFLGDIISLKYEVESLILSYTKPGLVEEEKVGAPKDYHAEIATLVQQARPEALGGKLTTASVFVYCANQFHALRTCLGLEEQDYIKAMAKTSPWDSVTGGKTKARFLKTLNGRFILKTIKRKEKDLFIRTAPQYFKHMCKTIGHEMPSVIVKYIGLYKIKIDRAESLEIMVMENLYYGINATVTYDLKGSKLRRYIKKEDKSGGRVLLDTNFKEDHHGEPLMLEAESALYFHEGIHNDTLLLAKLNVMDYSLLVVIDEEKNEIRAGIIDYLREYNSAESLEYFTKKILSRGTAPTVVEPYSYKRRFREAMKKYFVNTNVLHKIPPP